MRLFRWFLVFLLSVAIPFQGVVGLAVAETPCPMSAVMKQSMMKQSMMAKINSPQASTTEKTTHRCCNDADTIAKTGKLCKSGQECQSSSLCPIVQPEPHVVSFPRTELLTSLNSLTLSFTPPAVWRPPAHV